MKAGKTENGAQAGKADNVRNQREHLVLLLANGLMHLFLEPSPEPTSFNAPLEANVVKRIRKKVTGNYAKWCRFIGCNNNMHLARRRRLRRGRRDRPEEEEEQHEQMGRKLMHTCLFLLIWGEAANLRFMPQ